MNITLETVDSVFTYHSPKGDQTERYQGIRQQAKFFAYVLLVNVPDSRERSLALTHLQESVMWANAAIAINEA